MGRAVRHVTEYPGPNSPPPLPPSTLGLPASQVSMIGVAYTDDPIATGYGSYLVRPLLRSHHRSDMSLEEAVQLLEKGLGVLFARDSSFLNKIQVGGRGAVPGGGGAALLCVPRHGAWLRCSARRSASQCCRQCLPGATVSPAATCGVRLPRSTCPLALPDRHDGTEDSWSFAWLLLDLPPLSPMH